MPEIVVNINDQDYAIVCDSGEENHLKNMDIFGRFSNKNSHETKEKNGYKGICNRFILGW